MSYNIKQNEDGSVALEESMTGNQYLKSSLQPFSITFTPTAGSTNVCDVELDIKDAQGNIIANVFNLDIWLSDASSGAGLTATAPSGGIVAKSASGTDLITLVSSKALHSQSLATGKYTLQITDTGKTGYYVCASLPGNGGAQVSAQLVTGNYG